MPDVFEEEDEEDVDSRTSDSTLRDAKELKDGEESNTGVHIVEVDESAIAVTPWAVSPGFGTNRRKKSEGLAISTDSAQQSPTSVQKPQSEESSKRSSNSSSVEVVGEFESPRDRETFNDTITPPLTAENEKESQGMLRFSIPIPPHHLMTPDTLSGSSFSSPDFSGSQASLDTPRLGTGTSSMNEGRSFPFGELGPDIRVSVDDVPSLTSSRSTMTSPVNHVQVPPSSAGRSGSVYSAHSSTLADLRRKRGSIASLSKLVSANFGEKSKLSIESRPMSQHVLPVSSKERRSSRHRLSKLMAFWRGKEGKQRSGPK
jgi:hypothetical protein